MENTKRREFANGTGGCGESAQQKRCDEERSWLHVKAEPCFFYFLAILRITLESSSLFRLPRRWVPSCAEGERQRQGVSALIKGVQMRRDTASP